MGTKPPTDLVELIHNKLEIILQEDPAATSSDVVSAAPP
jgi:hypothetical protein